MGIVGIFYGPLVCYSAIILWSFCIFWVRLVYFSRFGKFFKKNLATLVHTHENGGSGNLMYSY
jgi:hypothetical protein